VVCDHLWKFWGKINFFYLLEKAQILEQSSLFSQNVKKLNLLAAFNEYYAYVYEECKV